MSYNIRFIGINRLYRKYRNEYLEATDRVLHSGYVVGGHTITEFETKISKISDRKHAISVSSGTDALFFILASCGIGAGDEVITTSYSFIATASSILKTGATPVFVDIDEHYHLCLEEVKKAKTEKTKAVIAVNLFGDCVDFKEFETFCKQEHLLLIEDAAQSFGASFNGVPSGKLGIASAFSFSPMKTLPCFGTGGAIVTDDDEIAWKCRSLRQHGADPINKSIHLLGYNSVIPADKAAQLIVTLQYVEAHQGKRRNVAERYITGLSDVEGIVTPRTRPPVHHCWHKFVIRSNQRDRLHEHLSSKGIETKVHYKTLLPSEPLFENAMPGLFVRAHEYAGTSLSLPIYAELESEEIDFVIQQIRRFQDREGGSGR